MNIFPIPFLYPLSVPLSPIKRKMSTHELVEPIIQNMNYPICATCKFYTPDTRESFWNSAFSICKRFGEKNVITGKIVYEGAGICRNTPKKCGQQGRFHEVEPKLVQKIQVHRLYRHHSGLLFMSFIICNVGYAVYSTSDTRFF
jgi:hypothetical protein